MFGFEYDQNMFYLLLLGWQNTVFVSPECTRENDILIPPYFYNHLGPKLINDYSLFNDTLSIGN